jgi:hypothetical protein
LFGLVFLLSVVCQAQDNYPVTGSIFVDNLDYQDVKLTIHQGPTTTHASISPSGHFAIQLQWNKSYWLTFSKPGYVNKIIEFSTKIPEQQDQSIEPFHLQVRLFKVFEGVDTVFFKKPVGKIYFDEQVTDFRQDRDYDLEVLRHIEKMRQQAQQSISKKTRFPSTPTSAKKNTFKTKTPPEDILDSSSVIQNNPIILSPSVEHETAYSSSQSPGWLPPLKPHYPEGKTVESFQSEGKSITRTIIRLKNEYKVLLKVEHNWGGVYYFLDESPLIYRSISKQLYDNLTINSKSQ